MLLKEGIMRTKENVNDARTLLGGSDVDWGPSRSGSGPAAAGLGLIVRDVLSALCLYCDAERMLLKYEPEDVMAINEIGHVGGRV